MSKTLRPTKLTVDDIGKIRLTGKKPSEMEVVMLIEYRMDLADMIGIDFDSDVMDGLREYGGVEILDTKVVDKKKKR